MSEPEFNPDLNPNKNQSGDLRPSKFDSCKMFLE